HKYKPAVRARDEPRMIPVSASCGSRQPGGHPGASAYSMAKILVAASSEPRAVVQRVLAAHDLFCAETMAQAEQLLGERTFDLIICTIVFDESRMFDLLGLAKSRLEWQGIPFVCARVRA